MPDIQTPISPEPNIIPPTPSFYRRHTRSLWLSLITIALAVAALLVYILFFRKMEIPPQYAGDVSLAISAPEESVSGSQVSYEITFENLSDIKLTSLDLEIFYPDGFSFIESSVDAKALADMPAGQEGGDAAGRQFKFSDLPGGQKRKIAIVGTLSGNVQEIKSITAKLHYVPENFDSSFAAAVNAATVILPPEITMRVLAPAQLISGQAVKYEIGITNVSIDNFDDLVLELSYPPGFNFKSAVPKPSGGETSWKLPRLGFGETQNIIVEGRISAPAGSDVYIGAQLFTGKGGEKLSAGRSYAFTYIQDAPIKLEHTLSGGAGTVLARERLEYDVSYENIGDVGLENVAITMIFETPVFDMSNASSQTGQVQGNKMIWQPGAVPELRVVSPGQRGKFTVRIPIHGEKMFTQKNPVAQTRVESRADTLPESLSGNTLAFKVGTNIDLAAEISLISGQPRLEAGKTSVYRLTLTVKNFVNDLENVEFTATVPRTDVIFLPSSVTPASENENFQYHSSARSIVWKPGKISAFAGSLERPGIIAFDFSITPETLGYDELEILRDPQIQGLDTFTGELVFEEKMYSVKTR